MAFQSDSMKEKRRRQVDEIMERQNLSAIAISSNDYFRFLSNVEMSAHYWERPFVLVIPRDSQPFAIMNLVNRAGIAMQIERGRGWFSDIECYTEIPRLRQRMYLSPQVPQMIASHLAERGLTSGRIGVDVRTGIIDAVERDLRTLKFVSVKEDLGRLRWIKEPQEIEIMGLAAKMGDFAMACLREELRVGRQLQEIDYTVSARVMAEAGHRLTGEDFQIVKMTTLSGPASASVNGDGAPTGAMVRAREPTVSVIVTRLNGYSVEVHRTFFLGKPSLETRRMCETAIGLTSAAINEVYAGNRLSRIDEVVQEVAFKADLDQYLVHRAGHGIGAATHEFPEDLPLNPRPILENEVFSLEPGLYVAGTGGFRFGDLVVAGKSPNLLTSTSKAMDDMILN